MTVYAAKVSSPAYTGIYSAPPAKRTTARTVRLVPRARMVELRRAYRMLRRPRIGGVWVRTEWQTRVELMGVIGRMADFTVTSDGEMIRRNIRDVKAEWTRALGDRS